jgi:hypothetical protein
MSDYKPVTLPSGVMLRKIKSEDEGFILSNIDQALIVTNLDIAAMYGLAYPEEPVDAEQAWHDVSQKLLESELKKKAESANKCIACTIQERDEQVKQMPRHTCGIDGPNPDLDELKREYKKYVEINRKVLKEDLEDIMSTVDESVTDMDAEDAIQISYNEALVII